MPENAASIISEFKEDAPLKAHPDYKAAKSGDLQAALRLTGDLITPESIAQAKGKFPPGTIFVPVIGKEASGHNQIPHAMALQYARGTNGIVDDGIVQSNEAYHTGARPLERMLYPALFEGNVRSGRNYVLIDDVTTMGNTLQELANHIRSGGGNVTGAVTLVNASRTGDNLSADPKTVRDVEGRFGNEVREIFGVEPGALSNSEARYLLNFKNADALRASSIAAVRERQLRLAAKGVSGFKTPEE